MQINFVKLSNTYTVLQILMALVMMITFVGVPYKVMKILFIKVTAVFLIDLLEDFPNSGGVYSSTQPLV